MSTVRMSADERRESVLSAAMIEFGANGFVGTSTEAIARRVGVSQPYLFRLFDSKKALFIATIERCFTRIIDLFEVAADGLDGEDALQAMGAAYNGLLDDRAVLQAQLQMWAAACSDAEIQDVTRRHMGRLWQTVERLSGCDDERVTRFVAAGMLFNVMAAMDLPRMKEHVGDLLNPDR
ncbi:MAG TPA: TetR/AcrR family transcriptional regulator [Micromonosporaceae bacterium]|jgi:AcrR family transcriptional regulator